MAQQQGVSEGYARATTQPFPIFENYLKMARFNTPEAELVAKCSIIPDDDTLLTMPSTSKLLMEESLNTECLMEIDDEYLLQTLRGDSDFSDTVSDFSAISITRQSKRKKKRSERWKGNNGSSIHYDINRRRVSPHGLVNHKTIIMQHGSSQTNGSYDKHMEFTDMLASRDSGQHSRIGRDSPGHSDRSSEKPRSHRGSERPRSNRSSERPNSSRSSEKPHSTKSSERRRSNKSRSRSPKSSTPRTPHTKQHDTEIIIELHSNDPSHTELQSKRSWSSRMEQHSSDSFTETPSSPERPSSASQSGRQHGHFNEDKQLSQPSPTCSKPDKHRKGSKRRKNKEKQDYHEGVYDEKLLGRNMRAVERRTSRKLRT